jgi:hypothetical protein
MITWVILAGYGDFGPFLVCDTRMLPCRCSDAFALCLDNVEGAVASLLKEYAKYRFQSMFS